MSALRELIAAAEAAGWDADAQNAPILNAARDALPETAAERDRLREVNAELLEALVTLFDAVEGNRITQGDCNQARAAIAKATGSAS
jgi:hypothetical protein